MESDEKTLRIVLVGKTGTGKSSLGNTLLKNTENTDKQLPFRVGKGLMSETRRCEWQKGERTGVALEVTDTPGLCDTHLTADDIRKENMKTLMLTAPGPHVILFVLRCDSRFTQEEYQAYQKLKEMFAKDLTKYLIVVFNGLDALSEDRDSDDIDQQKAELERQLNDYRGSLLTEVLRQANGRFFAMNNRASAEMREKQALELIDMMKAMVKGNEPHPFLTTSDMTEIKKDMDSLIRKKANEEHISFSRAEEKLKRDIIKEKVQLPSQKYIDPGLQSTVTNNCVIM